MVLLGRVKEVRPFKVTVSLPCAVIATLPITSISQVYTQHLQAVADSQNDDDTQVGTLGTWSSFLILSQHRSVADSQNADHTQVGTLGTWSYLFTAQVGG